MEIELGRLVAVERVGTSLRDAVRSAMQGAGIVRRVKSDSRVALKPNLTYPHHRPGVTTSPGVIREVVLFLRELTSHLSVVESDGGYGAWRASDAFAGHGVYDLAAGLGVEVVNLSDLPVESVEVVGAKRTHRFALPKRLLYETDLLITMPVPKIHCMTTVSLALKNQWGCVPDPMRLRKHSIFNEAIVGINRVLRPAVLADGTVFLDRNGPMEGVPVEMGLIIGASDAGAFDRYLCAVMGVSWETISHLREAAEAGLMPTRLEEITCNVPASSVRRRTFRLERSARNWIALAGFSSRWLTWLGYESWFGRIVLHGILYAVAGRPVKAMEEPRG